MTATITITRDQLAYVLLNLGLATTGTGRTDEVFAALRAKAAADAAADAWDRVPATGDTRALFGLAEKAQLHPRHDLTQVRSRGRYGIVLDGEGADALFSVIDVSAAPASRSAPTSCRTAATSGSSPALWSPRRRWRPRRCSHWPSCLQAPPTVNHPYP